MKNLIPLFLFTIVITFFPSIVQADWINLTGAENARNIAEIYIEKDHVSIKLEVFVQDLLAFDELVPDDFFPEPIPGRPNSEERIKIFADRTFQIITDFHGTLRHPKFTWVSTDNFG